MSMGVFSPLSSPTGLFHNLLKNYAHNKVRIVF